MSKLVNCRLRFPNKYKENLCFCICSKTTKISAENFRSSKKHFWLPISKRKFALVFIKLKINRKHLRLQKLVKYHLQSLILNKNNAFTFVNLKIGNKM